MTELTELYQTSLEEKGRALWGGLKRLGYRDFRPEIHRTILDNGFRTRAKFKFYRDGRQTRACGTDPMRGELALRDMLWILPPWVRDQVLELPETLVSEYGAYPVDGCELKMAHGRTQVHVTLSVPKKITRDYAPLARGLISRFRDLTGVAVPSQGMSHGDPWIRHEINGREFLAHYSAFFQSHPELTPGLLDITKEMMGSAKNRGVLDLYCGVGLLSLYTASSDAGIVGVESHQQAVESARLNAARQGFSKARFVCSPVESFAETAEVTPDDAVLLDPPRSGLAEEVIRGIARQGPQNVFLVSCFAETLFRDLAVWKSCGYALREIAALDMFPFTVFMETVSRLEKTP